MEQQIKIDGKIYLSFDFVKKKAYLKMPGQRYGQALFNVLYLYNQYSLSSTWPELFYVEGPESKAEQILFSKFDLVDGFLFPKE